MHSRLAYGMHKKDKLIEAFLNENGIGKKTIEAKLFSDNLTGLANRALFEIELEEISTERWRKNISHALFVIDMDNFKHLNDTNRYIIGNLYLREISNRLKACLR